jgi:hypothetical protein
VSVHAATFQGVSDTPKPYRRLHTWQTIGIGVAALLGGLALVYVAGRPDWFKEQPGIRALVNGLGSTLIVSVAIGGLLNLVGKRALVREIFETARLSTDVEKSGLRRVGLDYTTEPEWQEYFSNTRQLDVFFAYARTWRNNNLSRLQTLASQKGAELNVYLPDLDDTLTEKVLRTRFDMTTATLRAAVEEARDAYLALRVPSGATISVFKRAGDHVATFYRFDRVAVIALYKHKKARGDVPTLVVAESGSLYGYVQEELDAIREQSVRFEEEGPPA